MIKKILRALLLCFLILFTISITAQIETNPPMRQVISSGGGSDSISWGSIDFTIGEAIITTLYATDNSGGFTDLTQGFQQPDDRFFVSIENGIVPSPCIGADKGSITFTVVNAQNPVTFKVTGIGYSKQDTVKTFNNLAPGTYYYTASDSTYSKDGSFTIYEIQVDCNELVEIYTGITPNGDGYNDTWIIDSITNFKTNTVYIFNRWGNLVWKGKDYDNTDVVWRGTNQSDDPLPDGTYFYIIEAGGETKKGWVELSK